MKIGTAIVFALGIISLIFSWFGFMDSIQAPLAIVCIMMFMIAILSLMGYILYQNNKYQNLTNEIEKHASDIQKIETYGRSAIIDRMEYTNQLLILIDTMITVEIINEKKGEILLNKKEKNIDADEVIKNISDTVFNGISPNVVIHPDNILTSKYIMKYIQKRTVYMVLSYITDGGVPEA